MEEKLRIYLKQYKKELLPSVLALSAFILLLQLIIPQVSETSELRREISTQIETNEDLERSEEAINSLGDTKLDQDYALSLRALPESKSIGGIFEALTSAASKAGVSIGSLNIQVGSVYEQDQAKQERKSVQGIPFLNLLVRVNGSSSSDLTNFSKVLYESIPIVEINSVTVSESEGKYDLDFYFKPINEKGFEAQSVVNSLTPDQQALLSKLDSWSN